MEGSGRQEDSEHLESVLMGTRFGGQREDEMSVMVSALTHVVAGGGNDTGGFRQKRLREEGCDRLQFPESGPAGFSDFSYQGSPSYMHGEHLFTMQIVLYIFMKKCTEFCDDYCRFFESRYE